MKGLLIKDLYVLVKQFKVYLIIILVWGLLPSASMTGFSVLYAAMLPVTTLSLDERSKWNVMSAMMPYTKKDIVLSKYIFGYIMIGIAIVVSLIRTVISWIIAGSIDLEAIYSLIAIVSFAVIFMSVNMPVMYKLGVEKGRIFFLILCGAVFGLGAVVGTMIKSNVFQLIFDINLNMVLITIITVASAVLINSISIPLSIKLYKVN